MNDEAFGKYIYTKRVTHGWVRDIGGNVEYTVDIKNSIPTGNGISFDCANCNRVMAPSC